VPLRLRADTVRHQAAIGDHAVLNLAQCLLSCRQGHFDRLLFYLINCRFGFHNHLAQFAERHRMATGVGPR